jgi:hypothetical protein
MLKHRFRAAALSIAFLAGLLAIQDTAFAQAQNGRGAGKERVSVSYYKTPPGRQDEWLALYKKYHRPIMQYQLERGLTLSSKIYVAGQHSPGQPWDIAIINISPPEGKGPKPELSRGELIKKLFPDLEDYVRGERERWALTIDHWDERFVELDINEEPFSLYYPIVPEKKPAR